MSVRSLFSLVTHLRPFRQTDGSVLQLSDQASCMDWLAEAIDTKSSSLCRIISWSGQLPQHRYTDFSHKSGYLRGNHMVGPTRSTKEPSAVQLAGIPNVYV